ncbi:MAG: hypothetical protein ACOYYS_15700 [Chloroflexota bacterium]
MKIVTNEKLIRRNSRIGMTATLAGLLVLLGGFVISMQSRDSSMFNVMWGALLLGFLLSQVGIYFGNRWGRRPRPDEALDQALKGMDDRYTVYHYTTPVAHLLVGPVGLWVLETYPQPGKVVYNEKKKRWQQKGGSFLQKYMRIFAQESLGRPDLDVEIDLEKINRHLKARLPDMELPEVQAALVFINPTADVSECDSATVPALLSKELKEYLRKTSKGKLVPTDTLKQINEGLA